jgi:hypothetical protein
MTDSIVKAIVAKVNIGTIEFEGLMFPDGNFGVSVQQLRLLAFPSTSPSNALRELKSACGKDFGIFLHTTELSNNPQWVIKLDQLNYCLTKLALKGHKEAEDLLYGTLGINKKIIKETNRKKKQGYIYLLEGSNALKLGYSTNVSQRLKALNRWKGELDIVAKVKGTINKEKTLHSILHNTGDYLGDEWYPVYRKHEILALLSSSTTVNPINHLL